MNRTILAACCLLAILLLVVVAITPDSGLLPDRSTSSSPVLPSAVELVVDRDLPTPQLVLHNAHTGQSLRPAQHALLLPDRVDPPQLPGSPRIWRELARFWGEREYVGKLGFQGLQRFAAEEKPTAEARLPLPGNPVDAVIRDNLIYLACDRGGLLKIDTSTPLQPRSTMAWPLEGLVSITTYGNRLYLLTRDGLLEGAEFLPDGTLRRYSRTRLLSSYRYLSMTIDDQMGHVQRLLIFARALRNGTPNAVLSCLLDHDGAVASRGIHPLPGLPSNASSWVNDNANSTLRVVGNDGQIVSVNISRGVPQNISSTPAFSGRVGDLFGFHDFMIAADQRSGLQLAARSSGQSVWSSEKLDAAGTVVKLIPFKSAIYAFSHARGLEVYPRHAISPLAITSIPLLAREAVSAAAGWLPPGSLDVVEIGGFLLILDRDGNLWRRAVDNAAPAVATGCRLGAGYRWLAAGAGYVYAGGGASLCKLEAGPGNTVSRVAEGPFPGDGSHDGVVLGDHLLVAAGRAGLLSFDLGGALWPVYRSRLALPRTLAARSDIRALAVCGQQLLAAAGQAGIVRVRSGSDGVLHAEGIQPLPSPVTTLVCLGDLVVAGTADAMIVAAFGIDSAQIIGTSPPAGMERLRSIGDRLLGRRNGQWESLPPPVRLGTLEGNPARLIVPGGLSVGPYRLALFNRHGVSIWPQPLTLGVDTGGGE